MERSKKEKTTSWSAWKSGNSNFHFFSYRNLLQREFGGGPQISLQLSTKVEERGKNNIQIGGYAQGFPDFFPHKVHINCYDAEPG